MKKSCIKLLSILLAIMLGASVLALSASAAGPSVTLTLPSAAVGTDVTVTVKISANSNAASGNFTLQYDNSKLTVKSMTKGSILGAYNPTINMNYSENSVRLVFAGATGITAAGNLCTIVFTPKAAGTAAFTFTKFKLADENSDKITDATATGGSMTISAGSTVKYKLIYNANGGVNPPSSQTYTSGGEKTISATKPTRDGYTFVEWNTKSDGSGTGKQPGGTIDVQGEVTLYAIWKKNDTPVTYKLIYNANGGVNPPSSQTYTSGGEKTISTTKPTRDGYTFVEWNTKSDGSGTSKQPGGTIDVQGEVTLYAIWKKNATPGHPSVKAVAVDDIKLNYKASATLKPQITADDGAEYTVSYSSSATNVASVDAGGKVMGAKRGTATITCTVTDEYGGTVKDTCTVTVKYSFVQWLIIILLFGWIWY